MEQTNKQAALAAIDRYADRICRLSDAIWDFAELSLQEHRSAELYCTELEQLGFAVERGVAGIDTAFCARWGSGKPVIGILAEYDALSGLSQQAGATEPVPCTPGGCGHGCGHNLLGAGSMAAAVAIKEYLQATGRPGTVEFYGCPGEEGGAAKAFMARDNVWRNLDAALTWHPDTVNEVVTGSTNSCIQTQYFFHGLAAHAAGEPERGRSALDAVELMNIGVQFLREHMGDKCRVHYAITDAGGRSPNVVQAEASVLYMVRSNKVAEAVELQKRVDHIAQGAALMTGTTLTKKFIDGLADTVPNHTLEKVLYANFQALGVPHYTPEELAFADKLAASCPAGAPVPGIAAANSTELASQVQAMQQAAGHAMNEFLAPYYGGPAFEPGSTDVGDVSWQTPTGQIHLASWPNGTPGHSWQAVSCGATALAHKALLQAGRVLAAAAIDLYEQPELLAAARAEFEQAAASGYVCPIPPDAVPTLVD